MFADTSNEILGRRAYDMESLSASKLISQSVRKRIDSRHFIDLYTRLVDSLPLLDSEYVAVFLEFDSPSTLHLRSNDHKLSLVTALALSSLKELARFWNNLPRAPTLSQVSLVKRLTNSLKCTSPKSLAISIIEASEKSFIDYSSVTLDELSSVDADPEQQCLVFSIVLLFLQFHQIAHKSGLQASTDIEEWVVKTLGFLRRHSMDDLCRLLFSKTRISLSKTAITNLVGRNIMPSSIQDTEHIMSSPEDSDPSKKNLLDPMRSLMVYNLPSQLLSTYNHTKMRYWIQTLLILWNPPSAQYFHDYFIANFVPPAEKSPYRIASDMVSAAFSGISHAIYEDQHLHLLLNWKNFILSRLPAVLAIINFSNEEKQTLEKAVIDAFKGIPLRYAAIFGDATFGSLQHYDFRKGFVKSLVYNKVLEPISFQNMFPIDHKVAQATFFLMANQFDQDLNLEQSLHEKLLNVNTEFTSLEESGLVELVRRLGFLSTYLDTKQKELSRVVIETLDRLINARDQEKINRLLFALLGNLRVLNIVFFQPDGFFMLRSIINYIDSDSFAIDEDDENFQDVYAHFGIVIIALMAILQAFRLDFSAFSTNNSFVTSYLNNFYYRLCDNFTFKEPSVEDDETKTAIESFNSLLANWTSALFDDSNDGLSDDLIKSINIKQIHKLIPLIYRQAVVATEIGILDYAILTNGLEYLSQLFLIPCLPSLFNWLMLQVRGLAQADANNLYLRVLHDIMKTNINQETESQDATNLSFQAVLQICSSNISQTVKGLKGWDSIELTKLIIEMVALNVDIDYTEIEWHKFPRALEVEPVVMDRVKSYFLHEALLGPNNLDTKEPLPPPELDTDTRNIVVNVRKYFEHDHAIAIEYTIEQAIGFQRGGDDDSRLFLNMILQCFINLSVYDESDRIYWQKKLRNPLDKSNGGACHGLEDQESRFFLSLDQHYAAMFRTPQSSNANFDQDSMQIDAESIAPTQDLMLDDDDDDVDLFGGRPTSDVPASTMSPELTSTKLESMLQTARRTQCPLHELCNFRRRANLPATTRALNMVTSCILRDLDSFQL